MCLFRKKSDKTMFIAFINGELKMFDSKKSMLDYCERFSNENYVSSLGLFKCELYNCLKS